ncbi:putative aminotransferase family protein [Xylariaceae sp. FL0662B]|nr:putative aminotransferase family protein [Xylariaceae sp. FL0662B]
MTILYNQREGEKMAHPPPSIPFGAPMRHAHFAFAPTYTPLNHGSYGTYPVSVRAAHQALRDEVEAAPDPFIVLGWAGRLARARALAANLVRCPPDDLVFVPNATTGVATALENLDWRPGDVALCYEVVYESLRAQLRRLQDTRPGVEVHTVRVPWPVSDDALVGAMVEAAREINAREGRRVRLAVVDTVVSMPGARVPFERLVPALQAEGALVLVDGAHGIGQIDIDLSTLQPDFFVTNLHKWLFVPRGCAALVVPRRHQGLFKTTVPTHHWTQPTEKPGQGDDHTFADLFAFTGTSDTTNYLCVQAALDFRNQVCGGEASIREYCRSVAQRSAAIAAEILGTDIMDCPGSSLRDCFFANIRLPLELDTEDNISNSASQPRQGKVDPKHADKVSKWFKATGVRESGVYFQTILYRGTWWWRISGMVYVEEADFRKGAEVLKGLCERVRKGEHVETTASVTDQLEAVVLDDD